MRAVKTLLAKRMFRAPVVLVAALAWFAISNHCALAALEGPGKMSAAHSCHSMSAEHAPAKDKNDNSVECCKVLRATLALSKNLVAHDSSIFALHSYLIGLISLPQQARHNCILALGDTGPPFARSFSETVLQRSLFSHAPPSLA